MPVYLFTYHAFGTWLPDREQGYVQRGKGILPPDPEAYEFYRQAMTQDIVYFDEEAQAIGIQSVLDSQEKQRFECYYVSTDSTHMHVLLSWRDERKAVPMRGLVKGSVTRTFNREIREQKWFVEGGSRKRVRDRKHFDYLMKKYLPKHTGWKWCWGRGYYK